MGKELSEEKDIVARGDGFKVARLVVGPLDVNCYVVWDTASREAVIIDPGGDAELIEDLVREEGLVVTYILNTHGHFDHVGADGALKKSLGAELAIHPGDVPILMKNIEQGLFFGIETDSVPEPDMELTDGTTIEVGSLVMRVIHTPGHSPGGVSLYLEKEGLLFTGDTIFAGSIGRTDLPGGSFETLISSIKERVIPLGDGVRLFSGHGPETTVADEKECNPFVNG